MEAPKYMQLHRAYLLVIGIWNLERKSISYRIYRCVMVGYFCMYAFRQVLQLIFSRNEKNNEMMKNVGLLITCAMIAIKALVCMSSAAGKIIEDIGDREAEMLTSQNEGIIKIYKYYVKYNRYVLVSFCLVALITNISALCGPILEEHFMENLEKRPLPLPVWMFFDSQKHYHVAYFIQCIDATCGCYFMAGTDMFFMSLMIFGICQLRTLNFSMRNLKSSANLSKIHRDHLFVIRYLI